jgi:hypothetical protein
MRPQAVLTVKQEVGFNLVSPTFGVLATGGGPTTGESTMIKWSRIQVQRADQQEILLA